MRIAKGPIWIAAATSTIAVTATSFITGRADATVGPDVVIVTDEHGPPDAESSFSQH